jgi:hypothetical protein
MMLKTTYALVLSTSLFRRFTNLFSLLRYFDFSFSLFRGFTYKESIVVLL